MTKGPVVHLDSVLKGKVEQRVDPERLGRIRVRVLGVHSNEVGVEDLPWALPKLPAGDQCGLWFIPPIGSWVRVSFEAGDCNYPVWEGGWWSSSPEFGPDEAANGEKQSKHYRFPTSWFGSQEKHPSNSLLKLESVQGVKPDDAPNNFGFSSPLQKRLELDDRAGRQRVLLADFWGNCLYINSENAVSTLEVGTGERLLDDLGRRIDKQRGFTLNSDSINKIAQTQVYTPAGWRMTWDDELGVWESSSPDGYLIRIDSLKQRLELWSKSGHRFLLDDVGRRVEVSTTGNRRLFLDDATKTCSIVGQSDQYNVTINEQDGFIQIFSGGLLKMTSLSGINLSSRGVISIDGSQVRLNSGNSDLSNRFSRPGAYQKPERLPATPKAWNYSYYEDVEKTKA